MSIKLWSALAASAALALGVAACGGGGSTNIAGAGSSAVSPFAASSGWIAVTSV